jgi:RNA polymerase sigma-70 factor, ECF subfamily
MNWPPSQAASRGIDGIALGIWPGVPRTANMLPDRVVPATPMPPMSAADPHSTRLLVQRAATRDPAAIEQLLGEYLPRLRQWLRCRMGPVLRAHESAADLAQSVACEVLAELDTFEWRGEGPFRHWLFVRAQHKLQDRIRALQAKRRDPRRIVGGDSVLGDAAGPGASPSQFAIAHEAEEQVAAAFDRLTAEQREALSLFRFCGLSHAKIAQEMGKSEGAVRNLIYRAVAVVASCVAKPSE